MHKRIISLFIVMLILSLILASEAWTQEFTLTLLHTNDLHGRIFAFDDPELGPNAGGLPRLATLIQNIRQENNPCLVFDAGDIISGTMISSLFHGQAEMVAYALLGYDAVAIGNHEFDYGQAVLKNFISNLPFPFLSANTYIKNASLLAQSHVIFEVKNTKILVIGITTPKTKSSTHPHNTIGLTFTAPETAIIDILQAENGSYDLVIILSHLGLEDDVRLAKTIPGIDVIIGGHSHTKIDSSFFVDTTLIGQAYCHGLYLGRIDLTIQDQRITAINSQLIPITSDIPENHFIKSFLSDHYYDQISDKMDQVIGYLPFDLTHTRSDNNNTVLGNLFTQTLKSVSGADLAVYNTTGIRSEISQGEITLADIYRVEPFGNTVIKMELTKNQIQALFNHIARRGGEQIAGASYSIKDGNAYDIFINNESLTNRIYTVATNDFLAAGGSNYWMLPLGNNQETYGTVQEALIEFLQTHPHYQP